MWVCVGGECQEIVSGDLTVAVGPNRLLDSTWVLAGREELSAKLSEIFAAPWRHLAEGET